MDVDKIITILFSLCILVVSLLVKRFVKSWTHPAVVFALFWFALTFLPLTIMWRVPIHYYGTGYILAAVVAFAIPSVFVRWDEPLLTAQARNRQEPANYLHPIWSSLFYLIVLAAIICIVGNLSLQDVSIKEFLTDPLQASFKYLHMRYERKTVTNAFGQVGGVLNYVTACLGGLLISARKARAPLPLLLVLSFTPSLLHMVLYSDKGAFFLAAAYFYGAMLVGRISMGNLALVTRDDIRPIGMTLAIAIPTLMFAMLSRSANNTNSSARLEGVVFYINSYALAHLYAFSDWIDHYLHNSTTPYSEHGTPHWGFWTFMAIGKLISPGVNVPVGYFTEPYGFSTLLQTNIYTMFRGLVYDFGVMGSLVFMFGLGWLGALAYRQLLMFRRSPISQSFYIFLFAFLYSSFLLSLLTWSTAYVVAGCVTLLLMVNNRIMPKNHESTDPAWKSVL